MKVALEFSCVCSLAPSFSINMVSSLPESVLDTRSRNFPLWSTCTLQPWRTFVIETVTFLHKNETSFPNHSSIFCRNPPQNLKLSLVRTTNANTSTMRAHTHICRMHELLGDAPRHWAFQWCPLPCHGSIYHWWPAGCRQRSPGSAIMFLYTACGWHS